MRMIPTAYTAGWERPTFEVGGRKLYPLTLGHARILYIAGSPFVVPGPDQPDAGDLWLAIAICARAVAPAMSELPTLTASAFQFAGVDYQSAAATFAAYRKEYAKPVPRFDKDPPSPRIPWPWMFAALLRREYGYTIDGAWAELCSEAFWMAAALAVRDGDTGYATLAELDTIEQMNDAEESAP